MESKAPVVSLRGDHLYLNDSKTNFQIQELIPPQQYQLHSERPVNRLRYISPGGLQMIQAIREYFGVAVTVNNWHRGGHLSLRGWRPPQAGYLNFIGNQYGQETVETLVKQFLAAGIDTFAMDTGSWTSIHKLAGAFDFNVKGQTADETRKYILEDQKPFMDVGLTTLEDKQFAPSWVHGDNRPTGLDWILIVQPAA